MKLGAKSPSSTISGRAIPTTRDTARGAVRRGQGRGQHSAGDASRAGRPRRCISGLCAFCRSAGLDVVAEHISEEGIMGAGPRREAFVAAGLLLRPSPIAAERILGRGGLRFPGGRSASPAPLVGSAQARTSPKIQQFSA